VKLPLREEICWNGTTYLVACDLIRPINRKALRLLGELDEKISARILQRFQRMLATGGLSGGELRAGRWVGRSG
jgi:hypothetical protein